MADEYIVLVDEQGNEVRIAPKLSSHHANTPLHKAFSCYIFDNKGNFLVTRRSLSKKVWPGVWTNSVCGHPGPGESNESTIARRAKDELGMTVRDIEILLPNYRYSTPPFNGIVENEICPVYGARLDTMSTYNPEEVESLVWLSWNNYVKDVGVNLDKYSYWAKDQLKQLVTNQKIRKFIIAK